MARLAILGTTDLGRLIAHHAIVSGWAIAGFFDNRAPVGQQVADYGTIIGPADDIVASYDNDRFDALAIGVGYTQFEYRRDAFEWFHGHVPFANIIHPSAIIDPDCDLGEALVILPGCIVDTGASLGNNVLLNAGAVVAHHSTIGDHSFIGPAAAIAGKVTIGKRCFIGLNSTIIDHVTIADDVRIGAGTLVTRDISEPGVYVGAPARQLATN